MRKNNYRKNIGSVSTATMRVEDLIPAFISELESMRPLKREHRKMIREIKRAMRKADYFDSEEASFDLNEGLFDALDEYALPYFYFGSHPGDGADYGFWLSEDWQESFDGITVHDMSEVPKGYSGEVMHESDHGNLTLYFCRRGRCREVWSIA
jgi:hypothetical protein